MQAGRLRHRITIQADEGDEDAAGQVIADWQDWLEDEPAEVIETGGAERLYGHMIDATATHLVRVRYRSGYTAEQRIVWDGRHLYPVNVRDPDGRRRELWITCREVK